MYEERERALLALELAGAFLEGPWNAVEVAERGAGCLDRWPEWLEALAVRVVGVHRTAPVERPDELVALIDAFLAERPAGDAPLPALPSRERQPLRHRWPIAEITSVLALADALELSDGQLAWLADVRGLERTVAASKLRNYRYRVLPRPGGLPRVIEVPKARLKEIQRWMLREILDHIPAHSAAHGFVRGRSVISHASEHSGRAAVLRLDLRDFFASVSAARVFGIFRTVGYTPAVAHVLTGLATNVVPLAVWQELPRAEAARLIQRRFWLGRQLATPHLPQGAPTSPALANLAAFGLDRRLAGLAGSLGLRYSRYADDLTFSGPIGSRAATARLSVRATSIARAEGFAVNPAKSVVRTHAQRQSVCGVVVNSHPNVTRVEYDRLKAILHNAARHGVRAQNRSTVPDFRAHLQGRIAWVASLNPTHGEKLWERFARIEWEGAPPA